MQRPARPAPSRPPVPGRVPSGPGVVRIIGGRFKRSKLPVADVSGLRPTPDRVRETLFNWLGQDLSGWRCLDMFAGSGALGLEAASRGAAAVDMVERDSRLARTLQANRDRLGADMVQVHAADAIQFSSRLAAQAYDLVFIDPPYAAADAGLHARALAQASRLLRPGGLVYLEAPDAAQLQAWGGAREWSLLRQARAGAVHYALLRRETETS